METQRIIEYLWPEGDTPGGSQVYAVLDGARDRRIEPMIRLSGLEYCCLYAGNLSPRLQAAAPYLVHLAPDTRFTTELLELGWGNSWGFFTIVPPDVTLQAHRRHFRMLLRVRNEAGRILVFRFYDPRVLRNYLPSCTGPELSEFFGPIGKIVLEAEAKAALIEYCKSARGLEVSLREIASQSTDIELSQMSEAEAACLCFEQIMRELNRSQWHSEVLARLLPNLTRHLPNADNAIQQQWKGALNSHWRRILEQSRSESEGIAFALGALAKGIHDWRLALACFAQSAQNHDAAHASLANLAIAHWQLTELEAAQQRLQQAIAAAPEIQVYRRQLATLKTLRQTCRDQLGADCLLAYHAQTREIHATLLGAHHAEALLRQHNDPDILRFARLPHLGSVGEVRQWIRREASLPGKITLALTHPEFGLVGVISIEQHGDAATFYYWIGREHQGRGHGRTALRLLKRIAFRKGIRYLFSSVHESNARSLSLMRRSGYRCMLNVTEDLAARAPFYCLTLIGAVPADDEALFKRLQQFLQSVNGTLAKRVAETEQVRMLT